MFYVGEKFDVNENKSYKTQSGAEKAAEAAGVCVFDDDGKTIFPAVEAAQGGGTGIIGRATVVFKGKLRVRNAASFAPETECGLMRTGDTVEIAERVKSDDGKPMYKTVDGYFISAAAEHTAFAEA